MKDWKNWICLFLVAVFFVGCANQNIKPRTIEDYYQSSGVEKYFLSEIPPWANFSSTSLCFRKEQIRYFDIGALMKSYSINYSTAIQIQASYNDEYVRLSKKKDTVVPFSEEQLLFFRASDRVNSKILFFDPPPYKRVHLVWVDGADENKLRKFLQSSVHEKGVPVLLSLCLTKSELEAKFTDTNYKMLTAEMLSVFDTNGMKAPGFTIYLDQFFKDTQELILYAPQKGQEKISEIRELKGKYQIVNY